MKNILIIVTGGTFDKEYNELTGELFFKETHLQEMLTLGRNLLPVRINKAMLIDSLFMTDVERERIFQICNSAVESRIVITHGTDTMAETAKYMAKHIKGKTIVITGAMIPYKFGSSDGLFNLGSALAFAQILPEGVYVAMNGQYFVAGKVRKNKIDGIFETIETA